MSAVLTRAAWRQRAALLWRMTRPAFLTLTFTASLLGIASAAACGCGLDLPAAVASVLLACLAHAGANVLNDYHDARSGADAANADALSPFTGSAGPRGCERIPHARLERQSPPARRCKCSPWPEPWLCFAP